MSNGYPISAISGKKEYMELIGNGVGYGGTYYSNPISLTASIANLKILETNDFEGYSLLGRLTRKMARGIEDVAEDLDEPVFVNYETGLITFVFTEQKQITNYRESIIMDWNKYKGVQKKMLQKGIYYHPDGAERIPLSMVHTEADVEKFLTALEESIKAYNREN